MHGAAAASVQDPSQLFNQRVRFRMAYKFGIDQKEHVRLSEALLPLGAWL